MRRSLQLFLTTLTPAALLTCTGDDSAVYLQVYTFAGVLRCSACDSKVVVPCARQCAGSDAHMCSMWIQFCSCRALLRGNCSEVLARRHRVPDIGGCPVLC